MSSGEHLLIASTARRDEAVDLALRDVARRMVALYKAVLGRGPTSVQAHFAGPDGFVVLLRGTFTVAERNLIALGEHARVREQRQAMQRALEPEARAVVEQVLKRRTVGFIAGLDPERDTAVNFFVLDGSPVTAEGRHPAPRRGHDHEPFRVEQTQAADGRVSVAVRGELDLATADTLLERLRALKGAHRHVRLDLSGLEFIDSTGLRAILLALTDAHRDGWKLEVDPLVSDQVRRLIELTNLTARVWPPGAP